MAPLAIQAPWAYRENGSALRSGRLSPPETGPAMRTNFQFSCDPPLARLRVTGELDFTTRDQLLDVFASLSCRRCNRVELDLDGITFIDLSALEVLDQEQRRLTESGGTLQVVAASSRMRRRCGAAR